MATVPVRCAQCNGITTAESLDDDTISLLGVTNCPECGGEEFTELEAAETTDDAVLRAV